MFYVHLVFCISLTTRILKCQTHSVEYSRYECGAHGKFEYCIDGIPGCVIGCHCHPGYYFDSDTKICEPNTKLRENLRRLYAAEYTPIYPVNTPAIENIPTPTPTDTLDAVTTDTDDLGDWLYNQFFKTIESQVMNNTNDKKPTRRSDNMYHPGGSGGNNLESMLGRRKLNHHNKGRTGKILKKRLKKRKSKKRSQRRKLLRITEDDSLFDSESSSGKSNSDSSSSSDSSSRSSSEEITTKRIKNNTDDTREHGHKKVVIFNKRPRPPLPSFIILPSMDTPYYPPIALPPPMPMFPMAPIPPITPCITSIDNETTTTKANVSSADDSLSTTLSTPTQTTIIEDVSTDPPESVRRRARPQKKSNYNVKKAMKFKSSEDTLSLRPTDTDPVNQIDLNHAERKKLILKLIAMLQTKHKAPPVSHNYVDEENENIPLINNIQSLRNPSIETFNHVKEKESNVKLKDFKYLSDLIHRVNISDKKQPTAAKMHLKNDPNVLRNTPGFRKSYNVKPNKSEEPLIDGNPTIRNLEDTYYMKLGRQIASLVRKPDSKLDNIDSIAKEINIQGDPIMSMLNENRYPSRSYWERFVRSPLSKLNDYLKNDNDEYSLQNLENEVRNFARTVLPMSLQELENILSTLQKHQTDKLYNQKIMREPDNYLNNKPISTQPLEDDESYKTFSEPHDSFTNNVPLRRNLEVKQQVDNINETKYLDSSKFNLRVIDDWQFQHQDLIPMININQQISYRKPVTLPSTNVILYGNNADHYSKPEYPELLQKYLELPPKKRLSLMKFRDLYDNYSKTTKQRLDLAARYHDPEPQYPVPIVNHQEILQKNPEVLPNRYDDFSIHPEDTTKYLKKFTNNIELLRKGYDLNDLFLKNNSSTILSEMSPKLASVPAKYLDSLKNYTDNTRRNLEHNTKFSSNPAIFDYNNFNYFSQFGGQLQLPSYRRSLSKHFETPSYFHHELQHFDYFA